MVNQVNVPKLKGYKFEELGEERDQQRQNELVRKDMLKCEVKEGTALMSLSPSCSYADKRRGSVSLSVRIVAKKRGNGFK